MPYKNKPHILGTQNTEALAASKLVQEIRSAEDKEKKQKAPEISTLNNPEGSNEQEKSKKHFIVLITLVTVIIGVCFLSLYCSLQITIPVCAANIRNVCQEDDLLIDATVFFIRVLAIASAAIVMSLSGIPPKLLKWIWKLASNIPPQ